METESNSHRASTVLVVTMLLLASFFFMVAYSPAAQAAVTPGRTDNWVPSSSRYIRDDSTAVPIFAFGASSNIATDSLNWVEVAFWDYTYFDTTDLKTLSTDGWRSGVAIVRDNGDIDDVFDVNDTALTASAVPTWNYQWWTDYWYCLINVNDPVPQNPPAGDDYTWFVVIRTSESITDNDIIRARIEPGDIRFTGASQPPGGSTRYASDLDVRETRYFDTGDGLMAASESQAVLGLDICDGGPYEMFDYVRVEFQSLSGFTLSDLATVTTSASTSGVALYRNNGNGVWDGGDTPVDCTSVRTSTWPNVYLYPDDEDLPNAPDTVDPEYWIVIRTSSTVGHDNRVYVWGDGYSISVNGTLDNAWDRQELTPDWSNDDYEYIRTDINAPSFYGYSWTEWSNNLYWDGSTFWFSGNMVWAESARLTASVGDSPAGVYYVEFSSEPGLGIGTYRDYSSSYYRDINFDATLNAINAPMTLTLMDNVGNWRTVDIPYGKDTTAPAVTIVSPADTDTVSGTVTVRATATDAQAGVVYTSAVLYVNGMWTGQMPWDGTHFTYNWDSTTSPDGEYRLVVQLYDEVNNLGSARVNVNTDNSGPASIIIWPSHNQYVNADVNLTVYTFASDFSPVTSAQVRLDGGAWSAMTYDANNGTWYLNLGIPGSGTHTIEVRATDAEGNMGPTTSVSVYGDGDDPTVEILTLSAGDEVSGTLTIRVNATDAQAMGSVIVYMDGGSLTLTLPATFNPVTGYYEVTLDTTALADGLWAIAAIAWDQAGRYNISTPFAFTVDNDEPTLAIVTPTNGAYIYGTITVQASAVDSGSGLDNGGVVISIDGGAWSLMTLNGPYYEFSLVTTNLADGVHTITVVAADDAGNMVFRALTVVVDNTRPTVVVVAPEAMDYVEGTYTFAVSAVDNLGIASVTARIIGPSSTIDVALGYNAASGYYEWTVDTTTWEDGSYSIKPFATEMSGRTFLDAATVTFYLDNNAPSLIVIAPMDGEVILNATYTVTVKAGDLVWGLQPGDVEWRVDANPWEVMQAGASDWTANWFTTDYTDGEHTLSFRATDIAGHVVTHSIRVVVDNNDPTVSLNTPSMDEYVGGVYTFSARAADSLGVRSVVMAFGFSGPAPLTSADATFNPSTGYWELTVDTATLPDGLATLAITATDSSGRQTTTMVYDFAVDNNDPSLLLLSPAPGEIVLDDTLAVLVDASDEGFALGMGDVEYNLDGTGWIAMENVSGEPTLWGLDIDTASMADGEHTLTFRVTDAAGHVTAGAVTFTIDLTDPTASIMSPVTGEFAMDVYVFRVAAVDSLGIAEVKLTFSGIPTLTEAMATYNPASGLWEFLIETSTLDDAEASVSAMATDVSGRTSEVAGPVDFTLDNNAPIVAFVSPTEGEILTDGQHMVAVSAVDSFFDVDYGMVRLSVDGGSWLVMAEDGSDFAYDWNTTGLSDGEHNLLVMAEDKAGHMATASINVIVDNHIPALAIVSPTDGQFVTGSITFQVASSDARGVNTVVLSWDEGASVFATVNTATNYYEYGLDTTTLVDGTYTLKAVSTDGSGLVTEATVVFHVDNTEPELEFDGPLSGTILDGEVVVTATATDTFIDTLQFSVDGVGWVDMEDGTGTFDSTRFVDGDHTITVQAIDGSGRAVSAESLVTIDNNAPVLTVADFPAMSEHLAGDRQFAAFSEDIVGVVAVTVTIGDEEMPVYINPATGFYEWTLKSTDHADGVVDMTFTSIDAAGHTSTIDWDVFVDNSAPTIIEQSPKDGSEVREIVHFEVLATDDTGIESVLLRIGHGPWITMNLQDDGNYLYKWETTTEDDQESLEYIIRVTDDLGNTEDTTSSIDVNNPMSMAWIALAVILAVLVLLGIFFMRKRDQEMVKEDEEPAPLDELEDVTADYDHLAGLEMSAEAPPGENGIPTMEDLAAEVAVELEEKTLE